jgi:hypothetical protein
LSRSPPPTLAETTSKDKQAMIAKIERFIDMMRKMARGDA